MRFLLGSKLCYHNKTGFSFNSILADVKRVKTSARGMLFVRLLYYDEFVCTSLSISLETGLKITLQLLSLTQ